ncbi:serine hydrolase domain-containing protein [Novilysobacter antarcticus]|uniref:serine hydrolase domain-containing protein n=1 Tax=Novilysobacter antarcticus TaxID=2862543 RepID=UPI001C990737|nr:serine hydrolase domain-containing protein [Lysobacter antarcticus]
MPSLLRYLRAPMSFALVMLLIPTLVLAAPPRADIARALQEEGLVGAVWATVDDDGAASVDAAGFANARTARPMRADDRVQVGSIAKTVLATGLMHLATEGRIDLDAPVSSVLPAVAFNNPWEATDPVLVRHLLDHTAGLDDLRLWQMFSRRATPDTPLSTAFEDDKRPLRVRSKPGSRFSYSNAGYALLGRVIEAVTDQPYERWLDDQLLRPLGMHDSTFGFVSQTGPNADARLAVGHFEDGATQDAVPMFLRPSGQFTTTAADMARFAQFLMSDGALGGKSFIDPAMMRSRGQAAGTEASHAGLEVGYALGLALRDRHGTVGLCHGGDTVGFRAMLCVFPDQRRAFFVAFNADVESADYARLRGMIMDALDVRTRPMPVVASSLDPGEWEGFYILAPNRFATFEWVDTLFGFIHVSRDGDGLRVRTLQAQPMVLKPLGGQLFRQPDRVLASHVLLTADHGSKVIANDHQSYQQVSAVWLGALWTSLIAGMLGLLYVLVLGGVRLLRRQPWRSDPLRVPLIGVAALVLPVPLFLRQSFLQLGDPTTASIVLAVVTAALPLAMLFGLGVHAQAPRPRALDAAALLAVLQWVFVLAVWGLMPMRMWV